MAGNALGSASLILKANSTELDQGLNQANKSVTTWVTQVSGNVAIAAQGIYGALTAAFSAVTSKLGSTMSDIAASAKQAQALGTDTEFFMAIQRKAGKSAEEFGANLAKMLRTLGEARGGNQEATDAFTRLGLSMNQVKDAAPEEVFTLVAQKISEIKNPADQAVAAIGVFGKSGAELLPLFNKGAAGIQEAVAKAKELGIALNDVDAAKVQEAQKAMKELKDAIQGAFNQVAVLLSPIIGAIRRVFTSIITMVMPLIKQIIDAFVPVIDGVVNIIKQGVEMVRPVIMLIADAFSAVAALVAPIIDAIVGMIQSLVGVVGNIFGGIVGVFVRVVKAIIDAVTPIASFIINGISQAVQLVTPVITTIGDVFSAVALLVIPVIELIINSIQALIDIFSPLWDAIASLFPPFNDLRDLVVNYVILPIVKGFRMLIQVIAAFVTAMSKIPFVGKAFKGAAEGLNNLVDKVKETENKLTNPQKKMEEVKPKVKPDATPSIELALEINKAEQEMKKQIATIGMSKDEIQLWELAQKGATEAQLQNLKALQMQRKEMETSDAVRKTTEELSKQIATIGMTADEMQRWELMLKGATEAQLEEVKALQEQRAGLEKVQKLMEDGKALTQEMRTPIEKFRDEMDKLKDMLDVGAISWDTYERAATKSLEEIQKASQQMEIKLPTAMMAGSQQAVETIIKAQMAGQPDNSREAILQRMQAEQLEQQKLGVSIARETLSVIKDKQTVTAV